MVSTLRSPTRHIRTERSTATNWDTYYCSPYKTASITRRITGAHLLRKMQQFSIPRPSIAELGGADSCFFELIQQRIKPREYYIIDNNRIGLERMRERCAGLQKVYLYQKDVLSLDLSLQVDLVFSVGLIEHFDPVGTQKAVEAHFRILKPGGIAIITFPTATWLYRIVRRLAEVCGAWIFHDERPLDITEVERTAVGQATLLDNKIIWPIVLTQHHVVWRKELAKEL